MKQYSVSYSICAGGYITIEADNPEEAIDIVHDMDPSELLANVSIGDSLEVHDAEEEKA